MPSTLTQRARLRSQALLEPYTVSLQHLRSRPAAHPIVEAPSPMQARLEGLVLGKLGTLFDSDRGQPSSFRSLEPKRIYASAQSYTLKANPVNLVESLDRLLPSWSPGAETIEYGIPGLRYSAFQNSKGLSFHFPGQTERFNVLGVSFEDFDSYRNRSEHMESHVTVRPTDILQPQELSAFRRPSSQLRPLSAIARRLGILVGCSADVVDSWWTSPTIFSIELMFPASHFNPLDEISAKLGSPHFSDVLAVRPGSDNHRYLLETTDGSAKISLRYLSRGTGLAALPQSGS